MYFRLWRTQCLFNIYRGAKKVRKNTCLKFVVKKHGAMILNGRFRHKEDIFYNVGGETPERIAQRSCGYPEKYVPGLGRGVGLDDPSSKVPFSLNYFMIL